jgi:NAD(P)-dependent dehydrogenase (short-subunit alcohol dehydrogenase family)
MQNVLLTGASSGVARSLAARLRASGANLALACRNAEKLPKDAGFAFSADVSTESGALEALEAATAHFGFPPDAVANCAGSTLIATLGRTGESSYRAVMAANLDTAFFVAKAYAGALALAKRPGALVLFSSVVAGIGVANHAAIAAAKGGVEALTRALAADHSSSGLRVNCIAPGLLRTPMTERFLNSESAARQVAAQYPLGRFGEPEDAAALAAFLLSPEAAWITGQVIGLDGGFSATRPYLKSG